MAEFRASSFATSADEIARFVCRASDTLWLGIERALDNGLGIVLLTDTDGRHCGHTDLSAIRSAIRDGKHLNGMTLGEVARTIPASTPMAINAVLDDSGRIRKVAIDRGATLVMVSEPDLSHREFRNIVDAFLSTWISSQGDYVRSFERRFADIVGVSDGIACSNGTVALHLALAALGIGPGDEVIVPDLTFAATANAVLHVGARPIIVDIDPLTWSMTPETIAPAITPRTRAIIPVHLFGRPAPMTEIAAFCKARGLFIIEDSAEAHGATYNGRQVGSFSDISTYSFFANKIITTGEGGMCLTNDPALAYKMRVLRDHGIRPERRFWHEEIGFNFRMTNPQAAIGCAQLDRFDELLAMRRAVYDRYVEQLGSIPGVTFPPDLPERFQPVVWFACAMVPADKRAELITALRAVNIDMRPFANSMSAMPAYRDHAQSCPVSLDLSLRGLNLPTSSRLDDGVVERVADVFRSVLGDSLKPARSEAGGVQMAIA